MDSASSLLSALRDPFALGNWSIHSIKKYLFSSLTLRYWRYGGI